MTRYQWERGLDGRLRQVLKPAPMLDKPHYMDLDHFLAMLRGLVLSAGRVDYRVLGYARGKPRLKLVPK